MDPVWAKIHEVAVGERLLVHPAADPVSAFNDGDFEPALQQDVCTAKSRKPGPDDAYVGTRGRVLRPALHSSM